MKIIPIFCAVFGSVLFLSQIASAVEDEVINDSPIAKVRRSHAGPNGVARRTVTRRRQIHSRNNADLIEMIDVKCNQKNGILVKLDFAENFNGVVYSQGHFNEPRCRFVPAGSNQRSYEFLVPFDGCGSKAACSVCDSVENILVIQKNELIQEDFDIARKVSCDRHEAGEKTIIFKPFVVEMLEVVDVPTALGGVQCWMDIQRGLYPQTQPLGSVIKIGETLSVLVFLRDQKHDYDLVVRDCWAFDNENYNAPTTGKLQLSDKAGCSRREKLFGSWRKTTDVGSSGATLVLFNNLQAFKFPDRAQVFLKCDVEICRGKCEEPRCGSGESSTEKVIIASTPARDVPTTYRPAISISTTDIPSCHPGSNDIRCNQVIPTFPSRTRLPLATVEPTVPARSRIPLVRVTTEGSVRVEPTVVLSRGTRPPRVNTPFQPIPTVQEVTTLRNLETLSQSSDSAHTITKPNSRLQCYANSIDPRCRSASTRSPHEYLPPVIVTEAPITTTQRCYPGSRDPRCPQPTTAEPPLFKCFPGSKDPRCPQPSTTEKPVFRCLPGSTDPRCPQPTTQAPFRCYPGSTDPRCPQPTTTTPAPFRCYPGSTDPRCPQPTTSTPAPFRCYPGSTDPRCPQPTTTRQPPTYLPPVTTTTFRCYPGSTDPRCPQPTTTTPAPFRCYPGSTDPRCPQPSTTEKPVFRCLPGSTDPRCPQPTTQAPFRCYPGSTDPRCPTPFVPTTPASCYPGSPDPRCPQPDRPASTRPPSTYLPPFDFNNNRITRESSKWDLINEINSLDHDDHSISKRSVAVEKEVISITLNLKGFNFAEAA